MIKINVTDKQLTDLNGVLNYYIDENERSEELEIEMKQEVKRLIFLRRKVQKEIRNTEKNAKRRKEE